MLHGLAVQRRLSYFGVNHEHLGSTFFLTVAGSQLYGTSTPTSDLDLRGVTHQPIDSLIGLQPFEQFQNGEAENYSAYGVTYPTKDVTIYGLNKFVTLAMGCNPNIIELMFAPVDNPDVVLVHSPEWNQLMEIRSAFLSRKARHTFTGYAYAQLERINRHHRWIVNPPTVKPNPFDYSAYHAPDGNVKWRDNEQYNRYLNLKREWDQYEHWLKERNPARAELERKYGYDTKNGMHLVRLMLMGQESTEYGTYHPAVSRSAVVEANPQWPYGLRRHRSLRRRYGSNHENVRGNVAPSVGARLQHHPRSCQGHQP